MAQAQEFLVRVAVPEHATKQLSFRERAGKRVLTISSNFLSLFGFEKGDPVVEESLGPDRGIVIRRVYDLFNQQRPIKRVYGRTYKQRRNNPFEHQLEVASQKLIDASFPAGCTRVHVSFDRGEVRVTPIFSIKERALANARRAYAGSVFAALTSGVDLASMRREGFKVSAVLEWRPQEKRDTRDLTETGAMTALANSGDLVAMFNEDITNCNVDHIGSVMRDHPTMVFHASPQCDDLSNVKAKSLKARAEEENTSTADMIIDLLNLIERVAPPVIVFENVPGMLKSAPYEVAKMRLRRWGYAVHEHVGDARLYGGLTSRKRAYVVCTALEGAFAFEAPFTAKEKAVWERFSHLLEDCRDVSGSKSLQKGKENGRLRAVRPDSVSVPTPLKSQEHMCKDSLVFEPEDGVFLWPTEEVLKTALGIENVDLNAVAKGIATEVIGQSIEGSHHRSIMRAVRAHISEWCAKFRKDEPVWGDMTCVAC